jgi:hypothetical protein
MTSTTPRIITLALASLAIAAPAATAMPMRDAAGVETSSLAGTTSKQQDLAHLRASGGVYAAPAPAAPKQDVRNADNRAPRIVRPLDPVQIAPNTTPPVVQHPYTADQLKPISSPVKATGGDDGTSPFVFIIPAVVLIGMAAAGFVYTRTSRTPRRSPA